MSMTVPHTMYGLPDNAPLKAEFAFCYLINIIPTDIILEELDVQNIATGVRILKSVTDKLHNCNKFIE